MADDMEIDVNAEVEDLPQMSYGPELVATARSIRDTVLSEFDGTSEDTEEYVELTPDGQAIVDGAFRPMELYRIAEAASECQRRCAPAIGHNPLPPADAHPQPLAALHRLRFTIGPSEGGLVDRLLVEAEHGIAIRCQHNEAVAELCQGRQKQIDMLTHKLAQVYAVVAAERQAREAGGSVISPSVMDELFAALQAVPT